MNSFCSFPLVDRVRYNKNPLKEVVCQIRFPRDLQIETRLPLELQTRIKSAFPIFANRENVTIAFAQPIGARQQEEMQAAVTPGVERSQAYEFRSTDDRWIAAVTGDSVSLTTAEYESWEEFSAKFLLVLKEVIAIYQPPHFTRIGLRYRDIISRKALGLDGVQWKDLLRPELVGPYSSRELPEEIVTTRGVWQFPIERGNVQLQHAIVLGEGPDDRAFMIDTDIFVLGAIGAELGGASEILGHFNRQGRYIFQWCIRPKLHEALDPSPVR